jgi:hypothetical protein
MPEFTEELTTFRRRLEELQRTTVREMLWEDPRRMCQPFWDVAIFDNGNTSGPPAPGDDGPVPAIVFSAKPFVQRRASSRAS